MNNPSLNGYEENLKKIVELNLFLQEKNVGRVGDNVIDIAMDLINEQSERVNELEKLQSDSKMNLLGTIHNLRNRMEEYDQAVTDLNEFVEDLEDENNDIKQQNKRYRDTVLFVNEELITLLEVENLTNDEKMECIKSAKRKINESFGSEPIE